MRKIQHEGIRGIFVRWAHRTCFAVLLGGAAVAPSRAGADDNGDAIAELKQRMAMLEQDNRELRTALNQRSNDKPIAPLISAVPPAPEEEAEESDEEKRIGFIVEKRLRRLNADLAATQASQADNVQDMKIYELQGDVGAISKKLNGPSTALGTFSKDGVFLTSNDGQFKTHIGGVVQMDYVNINSGSTPFPAGAYGTPGNSMEGTQFRRMRLRGEGTMYQNIDWVAEVDLAFALQNVDPTATPTPITGLRNSSTTTTSNAGNVTNTIQTTTVFATFKDIPFFGNIRVGSQQDWFSMEHIESARFLDFMERSPIMDAFSGPQNNGYTPGVSAFTNTADKNLGVQYGFYKNQAYDADFTYSFGNAWEYGGRVIWTPYYDEESQGRYLLHTGVGAEYRSFNTELSAAQDGQNVRVRSRGDLRTGVTTLDPNFADTGNFFAKGQSLIDPEIAFQYGPLLIQAEYTLGEFNEARAFQTASTRLNGNGRMFMSGGYAEALYFLTGENRDYNRVSGVFNRVVPKHNFKPTEGCWGAWQVGLRYDWLDLNSGQINGGVSQNGTLGLNWFLNPNLRFQLNYVCSWVNASPNDSSAVFIPPGGNANAFQGAKFIGNDVVVNSIGTRMDFTY